jgi:hypothetical protein
LDLCAAPIEGIRRFSQKRRAERPGYDPAVSLYGRMGSSNPICFIGCVYSRAGRAVKSSFASRTPFAYNERIVA